MNVLLVDDNKAALKQLETVIKQVNPMCTIFPCETIEEALKVLEAYPIEIAFMELQLPGVNGMDLIMIIKGNPVFGKVRLVVVTDTGEGSLLQTSLNNIVDHYLHKPVSNEHILKIFY